MPSLAVVGRAGFGAGHEGGVDVDQDLLLALAQVRVAQDGGHQVGVFGLLVEDAGPDVEGFGADAQGLGDVLEDPGRGLPEPPLDLGQVRVGDAGELGQVAH